VGLADHGPDGTGEPLAVQLRPGNAGSNTAADHIAVTRAALAQLPSHRPRVRPGRRVLVRTDAAGCTHAFLDWLASQRLTYSVGFTLPSGFDRQLALIPDSVWAPAYDSDGQVRDGAWVAEVSGLLDLTGWPPGMRVIVRKERAHPGAQPRITDLDGHRVTAFATNSTPRAARRPGAAAPAPGPRRGPDPVREGRRAVQPALARLRPEPDLVRGRHARLRDHRLAADARPRRSRRAPVGTETAPAAALQRRRAARRHRPAHHPAPEPSRPVDPAPRRRGQRPPRSSRPHLSRATDRPDDPSTPRPVEAGAHPRRDRANGHTPDAESETTPADAAAAAINGDRRKIRASRADWLVLPVGLPRGLWSVLSVDIHCIGSASLRSGVERQHCGNNCPGLRSAAICWSLNAAEGGLGSSGPAYRQ